MDNLEISIEIMEKATPVVARATISIPLFDSGGSREATIKLSGFQIMHNKYKPGTYNVTPPSLKKGSQYKAVAFTLPPEKWEELKQRIINEYLGISPDPFTTLP